MSHICPFCSNETAGADPCPWCGGSLGVVKQKPHIEPVVIHDDKPTNPWPIAAAVLVVLVLGTLIFEHRKTTQEVSQLNTTSGPELVVNNHSPLFQSPAVAMPELARTTSLKTNPPPAPSKKAVVEDDEEDTSDDTADDVSEVPTPVATGPESVQLSDVQLATQDDGEGHEVAIGTATIYNPSQYEITSYQLYVATAGGTYRLEPFSGSTENPVAIENTSLAPGQRITVPIMSNGIITVTDANAAKTVTVEAVENGSTVTSHVLVN